jgi:aminomethyltransferase
MSDDLKHTILNALHHELGAKMVPFAGYEMPVQYKLGVMKEHLHTRASAGLFAVSHMGQVILRGPDVATAFETLVPVSIAGLPEGRQRYAFFTNEQGGIEDDLMVANRGDHLFVVVNAACKAADLARMTAHLGPMGVSVESIKDRALIALQGPGAEAALARLCPDDVQKMRFMDVLTVQMLGVDCWVSRSGYTGEDGYEISIPETAADAFARALLADEAVEFIGLGARDSLRLEAGLCLFGQDIDTKTTPVEAGLDWAIQKVRRHGGARAGGFPGADVILPQLDEGGAKRRVGLLPQGRAPMREGVELFASAEGGQAVGHVTSGGFGPSVGGPIAMGYVPSALAKPETQLWGDVRGRRMLVKVASLPFVPAGFKR